MSTCTPTYYDTVIQADDPGPTVEVSPCNVTEGKDGSKVRPNGTHTHCKSQHGDLAGSPVYEIVKCAAHKRTAKLPTTQCSLSWPGATEVSSDLGAGHNKGGSRVGAGVLAGPESGACSAGT
ncbi:hypothetical protein NDU88_002891 [Pleurodeles waltl]|uniref:Uncharacterized protein n=1 Tax=Pleurodeles waltl TaxID=8319 RepID=A0AAV7MYN5_PLEWA|nr:hypothetical protein NDU88_002891 [Pleurodeles waltl]